MRRQFLITAFLTHIFFHFQFLSLNKVLETNCSISFLLCRLGPRDINLSVDQWITDSLPPNSNTNTSNASASLLSQQQQQQSHQSKIMNVVVPNVACPPAAPKKIRRKPENKVSERLQRFNHSSPSPSAPGERASLDICFVMSSKRS